MELEFSIGIERRSISLALSLGQGALYDVQLRQILRDFGLIRNRVNDGSTEVRCDLFSINGDVCSTRGRGVVSGRYIVHSDWLSDLHGPLLPR